MGQVVSEPRQIPTPLGPEKIIDGIVELVRSFQTDIKEAVGTQSMGIAGVGVASRIVDCNSGEILQAPLATCPDGAAHRSNVLSKARYCYLYTSVTTMPMLPLYA